MLMSTKTKTYTYQLFDEYGRLYHPETSTWDSIEIKEETSETKHSIILTTRIIYQYPDSLKKQFQYQLFMHPDGRILRINCNTFKKDKSDGSFTIYKTKIHFSGNRTLATVQKENHLSGSFTNRLKKGKFKKADAVGMLHYFVFYSKKIREILQDLKNNSTKKYHDKIKSMEINPFTGAINYWVLKVNNITREKIIIAGKPLETYKITFKVKPSLFFLFLSFVIRIKLELNFWLSNELDNLVRFEEFIGPGKKVTYQLK
jgi:hypothetical protein